MNARRISFALLAVLGVTLTATPALAAGGHGFRWNVEGFYILDFVVLVVLLWAVLKGPIRKFFLKRHEAVKHEMETATRLRQEAEAKLAELDKVMSGLEGEIAQIRAQFQADGEREKSRILAEAQANADKLRANAKKSLEQELAKLREDLERELVLQVLASTEAKVRQKLDQASQKKLATTYVDQLEKLDRLDINKAA